MRTIALFGGSFNPPGLHHLRIARALAREFDEVLVVPCGLRPDKLSVNLVSSRHREAMVQLTFGSEPGCRTDYFDLRREAGFTTEHELEARYAAQYGSDVEIWHVVGSELVTGGQAGQSAIQRSWSRGPEIWEQLCFVVIARSGYPLDPADLPPHSRTVPFNVSASSTDIRGLVAAGRSLDDRVVPEVAQYIADHRLYLPSTDAFGSAAHSTEVTGSLAEASGGFCRAYLVDGGSGARTVVQVSDSVAVLFYCPDVGKVLLVRQRREAAMGPSNPGGEVAELCAGRFDVALGPRALVVKEAAEEVGATIAEDDVVLLNDGQPVLLSAGVLTERSYLAFVQIGRASFELAERQFGVDDGEAISRVWMDLQEFRHLVCQDLRVFALREWFFNEIKPGARS